MRNKENINATIKRLVTALQKENVELNTRVEELEVALKIATQYLPEIDEITEDQYQENYETVRAEVTLVRATVSK